MFTNLAKQMNNLIHIVLAERYLIYWKRVFVHINSCKVFFVGLTSGMNIIQKFQDKSFYAWI